LQVVGVGADEVKAEDINQFVADIGGGGGHHGGEGEQVSSTRAFRVRRSWIFRNVFSLTERI
jgi:hypothetical protein